MRPARRLVGDDVSEKAAVGRKERRGLRGACRGERPDGARGHVHERDVRARPVVDDGARGVGERDRAPVGRKGDRIGRRGIGGATHREPRGQELASRQAALRVRLQAHEPQSPRPVVFVDDASIVPFSFAALAIVGGTVRRDIGDPLPVGRPDGFGDVRRRFGHALGFASAPRKPPDVCRLPAAFADESQPLAIRRPARPRSGARSGRRRPRALGLARPADRRQPDLRPILARIGLEDRLANDVRRHPAVGRNLNVRHLAVFEGLERRPLAGALGPEERRTQGEPEQCPN